MTFFSRKHVTPSPPSCAPSSDGLCRFRKGDGGFHRRTTKLSAVATIFPQYDFLRAIGGDHLDLHMLLSPGAESHSFEPTPGDMITVSECDLFVYVGGDSDAWVETILDSVDTSNKEVVTLMDCVDTVAEETVEGMETHGHAHDHEDEDAHDHEDEDADHEDVHDHEDEDTHDESPMIMRTNPTANRTSTSGLHRKMQCGLSRSSAMPSAASTRSTRMNTRQTPPRTSLRLPPSMRNFPMSQRTASRHTIVFGDRFPFRYFRGRLRPRLLRGIPRLLLGIRGECQNTFFFN